MGKIDWETIMSDATLSRLAKRINKRFLYMSDEDIHFIFQQFYDAERIIKTKEQK